MLILASALVSLHLAATVAAPSTWPAPKADAVPGTDGYVHIEGAALNPTATAAYRCVWDATSAAASPKEVLPALNMAGSELNALAAEKVPLDKASFVVVFHGGAMDGILDNAHYRAKYNVDNPNLPVMAAMKKAGAALYVCGQNMAFIKMDPATISPDVTVASDALLVEMAYAQQGYALLHF